MLQLREKFNQADTDQGGALELEEFVAAFGDVIGEGLSSKELVQLFMRIDTNSDGSIDWDEFMNFIILENENLSNMKTEHCEYVNPKIPDPTASQKNNAHTDMITKLLITNVSDPSESFKYYTASNDGTVKIWNPTNMTPVTTINVSKNWVTSIAYLKHFDKLAAGTTDRCLAFYDLNKPNETISTPVSKISDLKGIPLTMDYIDFKDLLLVGDDQGCLRLYKFQENWHVCNPRMDCYKDEVAQEKLVQEKSGQDKLSLDKVMSTPTNKASKLEIKTLKGHYMKGVDILETYLHSAWITKAQYVHDIEGVLTSSLDKKIKQFDLERNKVKSTFSHHKKGVLSFVYCPELKLVASCGEERYISLWDPYSKTVAMTFLNGHNSAVIDLALNQDKNQLISLGTDKVVKIWDIRTFQCVQTIADQTIYRPENKLTGLYFNSRINSLLLTSKKINVWPFKATEEMPTSHECIVTSAIFNKNFSCIISADEESNVHVWDINEGKLLFKFSQAHGGNRITSMSLDFSGRRLITGAHDGSIKMWNFNNGQCLREFNYDREPKEVSKLAFVGSESSSKQQQIISVGWDKFLYIWPDENEPIISWSKCLPTQGHTGHTDDILSLTYCQKERLIVTGGQSGQIIAWHMETGFPKAYLHMLDKSLTPSQDNIIEAKSIEELLYVSSLNKLISVSADNVIRYWNLREITFDNKILLENNSELITCACLSPGEDLIIVGDECGNVRVIKFLPIPNKIILYHFNAHKAGMSSMQLFTTEETMVTLLLTTGISKNIKIFNQKGNLIGYLGQNKPLDIKSNGIPSRAPKYSQVFNRGSLNKASQSHFIQNEEQKKPQIYKTKERPDGSKHESVSNNVFRSIDIDKFKVEPIPDSVEECFKLRTGQDLILSLSGAKKL